MCVRYRQRDEVTHPVRIETARLLLHECLCAMEVSYFIFETKLRNKRYISR